MFNPISGPFKQTFILYDFYTLYCRGPPISADLIILRQDRPLATAVLSSAPASPPTPHGSLLRRRFNLELLMNSIGIVQVGILVLLFSYDSCGINILWCFAAITLMFNDHLEWLWWAARGSQPVFSIFCALDLCVIWCAEVRAAINQTGWNWHFPTPPRSSQPC